MVPKRFLKASELFETTIVQVRKHLLNIDTLSVRVDRDVLELVRISVHRFDPLDNCRARRRRFARGKSCDGRLADCQSDGMLDGDICDLHLCRVIRQLQGRSSPARDR